jgi:hypothetical protein
LLKYKHLKNQVMKVLRKNTNFYNTALLNFKKQYSNVKELTLLKVDKNNKVCGGEWLDNKGVTNISISLEAVNSIIIKN